MSKFTGGLGACLALAIYASIPSAHAAVDVNTGNEAALESVTGIGASRARTIVKEREANGPFKDADDLAARISGLGPKSIVKLKESGLTIGAAGGAGSAGSAGGAARSGNAAGTGGAANAAGAGAGNAGAAPAPSAAVASKGSSRGAQSTRK